MATKSYVPSEPYVFDTSGKLRYTHPIEANPSSPNNNFYRIINFEPEAIPTKWQLDNGYTVKDWNAWKKSNPHMEGTYAYDNYSSWSTNQTRGQTLNAEGHRISPLNDIYRNSQIRGTNFFNGLAYMNAGFPDEQYRSTISPEGLTYQMMYNGGLHANQPSANTKNLYIEMTPEFVERAASGRNTLYNRVINHSFIPKVNNQYVEIPKHPLTPEVIRNFASGINETQGGGRTGGYAMLEPKNGTPIWDRLNPFNRSGVRMIQTDAVPLNEMTIPDYRLKSGEVIPNELVEDFMKRTESGVYTKEVVNVKTPSSLAPIQTSLFPFNENVIYDGITPYTKRPLRQHINNAIFNAKTLYAQPETQAILRGAKTTANVGVGAAGLIGYGASVAQSGPVETVLSYGVPFTPMKMGIGPVLSLNSGEEEALDEGRTHRRELARASTINDEIDFFVKHHPSTLGVRNYDEAY